ncbi:MAG TPA: helix-turn-helix transcriptional regulator [Planctomycetaceae bacterium]|nr:helix-turn-helix transcriptional regulator [Planctomycetaceae bacterium]
MNSLKDRLASSKEGLLLWNQERAILDITELVCDLMADEGVTRKDLADRLETTKSYITQLLDGTTNMTVRTISDVFSVLGYEFHASARRMEQKVAEISGEFHWNPESQDWPLVFQN